MRLGVCSPHSEMMQKAIVKKIGDEIQIINRTH